MIKDQIYIAIISLIVLDLFSCKNYTNNFISFDDDDEIATITSDSESEFLDAIDKLYSEGGTIYIDTPVININKSSSVVIGSTKIGGVIGIRQPNGEYPRIDFMRSSSGFRISGSNKFIENIIIENVKDVGVAVTGDNNILVHVISRYNYGSGFHVTGNLNLLKYCYSYRNYHSNKDKTFIFSDGFSVSGKLNNILNYCFAWDNGYSGFDNILTNSSELSYSHCGSWNNGNIDVFTGKYDYDNGNPLDKKLWTIKEIMDSDPNFETNYYNKKYNVDDAYMEGLPVKERIANILLLDGSGFSFTNYISDEIIVDAKRNLLYCVAFEHISGGFINRYNQRFIAYVDHCISFNNNFNYYLSSTFTELSKNYSWGSKNKDQLNKVTTKIPSNTATTEKTIYSVREQIVKAVYANKFPDNINFDVAFGRI